MTHRALLLLASLACFTQAIAADQKPNVLLIVADDLGYRRCRVSGQKDPDTEPG